MNELDEFGAEFYLGDAERIGQACAAWEWQALRSGTGADGFVGFPTFLQSLDFLHLSAAIADVTGRPEVRMDDELHELAGEEGVWSAEALPVPWLRSLADVADDVVPQLCERWAGIIHEEYDMDWDVPAVIATFPRLLDLTRRALATGQSVVTVWQQ